MRVVAITLQAHLGMRKKARKRRRVEKEQLKREVICVAAVTPLQ